MGKNRSYQDSYGRTVTIKGGKHYFDERTGGNRGRLHEDQFSIDGRSWDYRDPRNQRNIDRYNDGRRMQTTVNPESKERFRPLYDYDFGRVRDAAKALGIGNVDEKKEVRQIIDYIQKGPQTQSTNNQEQQKETPEPLLPRGERVPRFNEPLSQAPGMSNSSGRGGQADANMSAIRGGDDLNEWYQNKFVPHLEADANATNSEIGDDSRYFLDKFVFDPPQLGNVQDVFEKYKKEIEDLD